MLKDYEKGGLVSGAVPGRAFSDIRWGDLEEAKREIQRQTLYGAHGRVRRPSRLRWNSGPIELRPFGFDPSDAQSRLAMLPDAVMEMGFGEDYLQREYSAWLNKFNAVFQRAEPAREPEPATAADVMRDLLAMTTTDIVMPEAFVPEEPPTSVRTGHRHIKLGFTATPEAKEAATWKAREDQRRGEYKTRTKAVSARLRYAEKYPQHSFLTEENVHALCRSYSLAFVSVDRYKGEIPEHCLQEIESFQLRVDDQKKSKKGKPVNPALSILAPSNKVELYWGERIQGNRVVQDDPIVLCPVEGGYLVVAAWGDEAKDVSVVNGNRN